MLNVDASSAFGSRVLRRLQEEPIIWLITVGADGTPQPSPVWFLWDGETVLIYSQPDTPKLRNIERQPRVALHFDGDGQGGDIIVLTGTAAIDANAPPATAVPAYVEKYRAHISNIGMDSESFAAAYSVAMRVTPKKVRGF